MKRILSLALCLILFAVSMTACQKAPAMDEIDMSPVEMSAATVTEETTDYVIISVKDFGDILVRLYPDVAPKTVENFKTLVSQKFYDGLTFHRIIKGFMIQGGDPKGDGSGSSDENIKGEFSDNGFENNLLHNRGVLSMARSNDMNSASCQFFIVHDTEGASHLNGSYASFGFVVAGMDVVDKIANVSVIPSTDGIPFNTVTITSIRFASVNA